MPVRVRVSRELGLVVLVFEGVVTADELVDAGRLAEKPEYSLLPRGLADTTRAVRVELPSEVIRQQARFVGESVDGQIGAGAKMALVATNPEFFGLSRMYEMLRGGSPVTFNVFRSLPEAEAWLELPDGYQGSLREI